MKFKRAIIAFLCVCALAGCGDNKKQNEQTSSDLNQNSQATTPSKVDNFRLTFLDGNGIDMQKITNGFNIKDNQKANLFVFFATWCPPCKAEIPHLNNLSEEFKDRLNIIGVLLEDKGAQEMAEFAKKYNVKYNISIGEGNFLLEKAVGGISALPASMLLKPDGELLAGYNGLVPEEMLKSDILKAIE